MLKLRDFGENSLSVTIIHPQLGKQEFLAKGGKEIGAKLTPWIQPLSFVSLWLAPTRGELATIREVEVIKQYAPNHPLALKLSLKILSFLDMAAYPQLECIALMRATIPLLNKISSSPPLAALKILWIQFEVAFLTYLGVKATIPVSLKSDTSKLARYLEAQIIRYERS